MSGEALANELITKVDELVVTCNLAVGGHRMRHKHATEWLVQMTAAMFDVVNLTQALVRTHQTVLLRHDEEIALLTKAVIRLAEHAGAEVKDPANGS